MFHILGFPFIFEVTGLEKAKRRSSLSQVAFASARPAELKARKSSQVYQCKIHKMYLASRPRGGIEPLHVSMSLNLKSSPNPSWNHGGLLTHRLLSGTLFNLGRHGCNYLISTLKTKPSTARKAIDPHAANCKSQVREHARPAGMEKTTTKSG